MQDRILALNSKPISGTCVVYVMSRDQRAHDNHALLSAQQTAIEHNLPLIVLFNLLPHLGVRAYEHYRFMLDGLQEVSEQLASFGIPFLMTYGEPPTALLNSLQELRPAGVYFDFSPLHGPRKLSKHVASQLDCFVAVVDTHNIIPAWKVSDKQEFAAYTMRPKVHRLLANYLIEPAAPQPQSATASKINNLITFDDARELIRNVPKRDIIIAITTGSKAAHAHLDRYIAQTLPDYALDRNNIANDHQSGLSPYLHFGHISSLRVALQVLQATKAEPLLFREAKMASSGDTPSVVDGMNALFEEMIVRKELADNFCLFASSYTTLASAPAWAQDSLRDHQHDNRETLYTRQQLQAAQTHDEAWNAAQRQLTRSGKMHGYMRMYWAKKILEWTPDPQAALAECVYLNDAYSLDGGDPNGYVGILWAIAGVHDRPWTERPIFGKIRYMNAAGLKRKFDVRAYIDQWS